MYIYMYFISIGLKIGKKILKNLTIITTHVPIFITLYVF